MLKPPAHVLASALGQEMVLLDLDNGAYFALNEVAARAWEHVCATGTIEGATAALAERFDVEPARLDHDLGVLLTELRRLRLIEEVT